MKKITPKWLGAGEFAWASDSGRTIKASVKRIDLASDLARELGVPPTPPAHGDVYLMAQAMVVDPKTGATIGAPGRRVGRHVDATNVAAGHEGWKDYWKPWLQMEAPTINPEPPANIAAGATMTNDDGSVWHGGKGQPAADFGNIGEFYRDLVGGQNYKRRIGVIEYFGLRQAKELDTYVTAQAQLDELPIAE